MYQKCTPRSGRKCCIDEHFMSLSWCILLYKLDSTIYGTVSGEEGGSSLLALCRRVRGVSFYSRPKMCFSGSLNHTETRSFLPLVATVLPLPDGHCIRIITKVSAMATRVPSYTTIKHPPPPPPSPRSHLTGTQRLQLSECGFMFWDDIKCSKIQRFGSADPYCQFGEWIIYNFFTRLSVNLSSVGKQGWPSPSAWVTCVAVFGVTWYIYFR